MVLIEYIVMDNCRLCHSKPGLYDINTDKRLIKDIYDCLKLKVNDKSQQLLPPSVCEECKDNIKSFSSFKQYARKVDHCLRKLLKSGEDVKTEEPLICDKCPAEFSSQEVFDAHEKSHLETSFDEAEFKVDFEIPCIKCGDIFKTVDEYGYHQCSLNSGREKSGDNKDDILRECPAVVPDNSDFEDTFEEKVTIKNFKVRKNGKFICTFANCKKTLSSAYNLKTHQLTHEGTRSFLCVTCGKGFITKNSLTCHEKIHLAVKAYSCKLCNIGFSVRSNLRAHEKKHHEGVRFYCSQCPKSFSSKCSLERHENIHTGIREFKCQTCPSAFYTRKELLKHQRYHQGLRLHKCDECFKTFFERHHLIIHLRSHTGERPYICKFPNCGKSFTESQKLKRHHNAKHAQV